jgi:hypothetical protein
MSEFIGWYQNMLLCEAPIDILRGAIKSYRHDEHPTPISKISADDLIEYFRLHKNARKMLPKAFRNDPEREIPLSVVRKTVRAYRMKYHPPVSKMRRFELEAYMRRVRIKPVGKELKPLKRNQCQRKADVDEQAVIDAAESAPLSERLDAPVKGPRKKKKKAAPKKRKQPQYVNPTTGAQAVQNLLPSLEARAARMDEDDSLAW